MARLPVALLIVVSRSGSMLLQTLLDRHPQLLQWPHTFKYFDFLVAVGEYAELDGRTLGRRFVEFPAHEALFDSSGSVLHRGRLGADMKAVVRIDREAFVDAMAASVPGAVGDARRLLLAVHLALAHCLGRDASKARAVLVHSHHGDWLWADELVERCNVTAEPHWRGMDHFRPDRLIVTVRDPSDTIDSLWSFTEKATSSEAERTLWFERYLRLLIQDWLRVARSERAGIPTLVVRLEDLRRDASGELARVCAFLGIDPDSEAAPVPTAYGLDWWGDIYTTPTRAPNAPRPVVPPSWWDPEHVYVQLGAGCVSRSFGYPALGGMMAAAARAMPLVAMGFASLTKSGRPRGGLGGTGRRILDRARFLRAAARLRRASLGRS